MNAPSEILFECRDGIATITLNRPDRLNAFTATMLREMIEAFDRCDTEDDIRVVIVTGAGRGFCAGADLSSGAEALDFRKQSSVQSDVPRDGGGLLALRIFDSKKPVIAAINGAAVGVGATMTLPMDIRLASTAAKFGFVFARRGIVPEACSSWFLPRVVGIQNALRWTFSGRVFDAAEAYRCGLLAELVEPEELLPTAKRIAREIADYTSPVSITLTRALLWRMMTVDHPMRAHRVDSRCIASLGRSPDAREGIESFLEKRKPRFPSRPSRDTPDVFPWWKEMPFDEADD
jgi:enoyl-CoA hydratase/carnithine racemase